MSNLDVFEVKWFLAVLAVERPLRALALIMALLLVEADVFLAGGAGDDHELALPLVVQLRERRRRSPEFSKAGARKLERPMESACAGSPRTP